VPFRAFLWPCYFFGYSLGEFFHAIMIAGFRLKICRNDVLVAAGAVREPPLQW